MPTLKSLKSKLAKNGLKKKKKEKNKQKQKYSIPQYRQPRAPWPSRSTFRIKQPPSEYRQVAALNAGWPLIIRGSSQVSVRDFKIQRRGR